MTQLSLSNVAIRILDFCRTRKLAENQVLPEPAFTQWRALELNPKEQRRAGDALTELVSSRLLRKEGSRFFLTEAGEDQLYPG